MKITVVIWLLFHCVHIWLKCTCDFFVCLSSCWLKWKPADVRGMQLKDDIIISSQSLPLLLSLSQQYSVVIVYSRRHSPWNTQGPGESANLHCCECVCACVHGVCISHELVNWYDSHGKYHNAKQNQPFTLMSNHYTCFFTDFDEVIKGRSLKVTRALFYQYFPIF